ncbi:MAG: energy transducer TonB family protein [Acidobacteriota bacterium]
MTLPPAGTAQGAGAPFAHVLLEPAVRPRPLSLLGSACLHAAVLFLLLHVPMSDPRALRMENYRVLPPPPRDRKLVWYKLDTRMPDVSIGRKYGQRPPRARVRSKDVSIQASTPNAPSRDQLIFQPAAPAEIARSLPLPNMAAFQPAPPPEPPPAPKAEPRTEPPAAPAPKRTVRAFTPPPPAAPRKPRPVELSEAPIDALPSPAALGQITAVVAGVKPMPGAPPALPEGNRPASVSVGPQAGNGAGGALNPSPASGIELISSGGGAVAGMAGKPSFASQVVMFTRAEIEQRRGAVSVPVRLAMVPEIAQKQFGGRTVYLTFLEKPNPRHYSGDILLWFAERGQTAAGGQAMHAPVPFRQTDPFGPKSHSPRPIRGTIRLSAIIGADGFLSDLRILDSPDDALDSPLLEAAARWTFLPALRGPARIAVDALFEIPVIFLPAQPGAGTAPAP